MIDEIQTEFEMLPEGNHLVIGDLGSGKTTLLKRAAVSSAQAGHETVYMAANIEQIKDAWGHHGHYYTHINVPKDKGFPLGIEDISLPSAAIEPSAKIEVRAVPRPARPLLTIAGYPPSATILIDNVDYLVLGTPEQHKTFWRTILRGKSFKRLYMTATRVPPFFLLERYISELFYVPKTLIEVMDEWGLQSTHLSIVDNPYLTEKK